MSSLLRFFVLKPSTLIFFVFGVALVVWAFVILGEDPGYLLLRIASVTLESNILVAAVSLLLLIGMLFICYRTLEWAFDGKRSQRRANKKTTRGLVALAEGNWSSAEKLLSKSAKKNDTPLVNYITAAQAAHEQGKDDQRDEYLRQAHESTKGVDVAIGLTKARLQFESSQWEQCLATLMVLKNNDRSPSYAYVIKMMAEVYVELNDEDHLVELLPEIKKQKIFTKDEFLSISLQGYRGLLRQSLRGASPEEELNQLRQSWIMVPKKMQNTPLLLTEYCSHLIALNANADAEKALLAFLKKDWDDSLVALYGTVKGDDVAKQLFLAEGWLKERPSNAKLLLTLGRLSLLNSQWDKARDYFEASLESRQSAAAFGELGRLLSHLGNHKSSNENFQKGLAMMSDRLPDLPMPELPM
ncbi:MAG: heme biosynthesis protein HemY [Moraxellaceae bacterium]|nr:MAG: heme biosynthesis protein HemY [Moraxellaceae bacterium]